MVDDDSTWLLSASSSQIVVLVLLVVVVVVRPFTSTQSFGLVATSTSILKSTNLPNRSTTMDFEGQKLSELIFHILIIACGAVGWIIGFFQQDFTIAFQAWLVGLVLSVVVRRTRQQ
jgi:membrane protein CcdC involved in cytochrome C biogenesis